MPLKLCFAARLDESCGRQEALSRGPQVHNQGVEALGC